MQETLAALLGPKLIVLYVFVASAVCVHYRGRVRHGFLRQFSDHSTLMAPYNCLMYLFSAVPNRPWLDVDDFPELTPLSDNWQTIRDEALALYGAGHIRAAKGYNDLGFNSFFRSGWKRFYVKWYDEPLPSAMARCPKTVALVQSIPSVNAALFALLPPGGKLGAHRDPYAGSLRFHLGLATPNSDACRIVVDGEPRAWRDGKAILFDETYIHHAENRTDTPRIILFCDIERPLSNRAIAMADRWFRTTVIRASRTENAEGDKIGFLNRVFSVVYRLRLVGKYIKGRSRAAYYTLKWLIFGALLYWICFVR